MEVPSDMMKQWSAVSADQLVPERIEGRKTLHSNWTKTPEEHRLAQSHLSIDANESNTRISALPRPSGTPDKLTKDDAF
jgi:hypothetical protein